MTELKAQGVLMPDYRPPAHVEAVAKMLWSRWLGYDERGCYHEWIEGGNSLNQDNARDYAVKLIDAADSTRALSPSHDLRAEAEFLCARLREFAHVVDSETAHREFYGHVAPALARLEAALATPNAEEGEGA